MLLCDAYIESEAGFHLVKDKNDVVCFREHANSFDEPWNGVDINHRLHDQGCDLRTAKFDGLLVFLQIILEMRKHVFRQHFRNASVPVGRDHIQIMDSVVTADYNHHLLAC